MDGIFAGIALLNEKCRTRFALAKLETQTCFALAKLETQTSESRLGVTSKPEEVMGGLALQNVASLWHL
jgi:hypothetical protein